MPQAVFVAIGLAMESALGAFLITASATLSTISMAAGALAIGAHQRRKAQQRARDAYNASLTDRLVMTAMVDAARSRIYGRVRNVDGVLFKATRGTKSEFYTLLIAVAGHEVDAIEGVYFNDTLVTLGGAGSEYVQTEPWFIPNVENAQTAITIDGSGNGSVTLPYTPIASSVAVFVDYASGNETWSQQVAHTLNGTLVTVTGAAVSGQGYVVFQHTNGKSYARVRKYLGTAAQDLSADLVADFPALCQSSDKFRGIALLRVDLEYSQEAFPTGVPSISAVVRGVKCFDPRNAATAWTQNPALHIRDWARYSNGGNTTNVSDTSIIAAANVCDADTSFVLPSGTLVMDTYQSAMVCKLDGDPTAALDEMVEAMAGRWGWASGILRVVAGGYRAPVDTITEDWISDAADILITPTPPRAEVINAYRPTIWNRDSKFQQEPAPPVIAAAYVTADGQQLDAEIRMEAVPTIAHAQHIAGVMLRDARQSLVVQLPCNMRAFKFELFDTVLVTLARFGWSAKLFEIVAWRWSLATGVMLTLKETAASVYDPDAGFNDLGNDDNSDLPLPWVVPTVTGVSISSGTAPLTDGSIITRTRIAWNAVQDAGVIQGGRIEVQYARVGDSLSGDWPGQLESGNATETTINGLLSGRAYVFRVRATNGIARGLWSAHATHVIALPPPALADVAGGNLLGNSSFESDSNADGIADGWEVFVGNAGDATRTHANVLSVSRTHGLYSQQVQISGGVTNANDTGLRNLLSNPTPIEPNTTYTISVDIYAGVSGKVYLLVRDVDSIGNLIGSDTASSVVTPALQWVRKSVTLTSGSTAAGLLVYVRGINLSGEYFRVDSFMVQKGSLATGYAPRAAVIYRQPTAPTSGLYSGDVWHDTDADNRMHIYDGTQWVDVSGRGRRYRAVSRGLSDTAAPTGAGLYNAETGAQTVGAVRSYNVAVIRRSDGINTFNYTFDVYADPNNAATMAATLNSLTNASIVCVRTFDEPGGNRTLNGLDVAMRRCGASRAIFESTQFKVRSAYLLVGIPGIGEGGGYEAYNGDVDNSTNAWCDVYFQVVNGQLLVTGANATPRTLVDYGYTGSLTATQNTIYRQATQPASGMVTGDLWFDTDDGNKTYYYTGSAWQVMPYDTAALATDAVTARGIGTLTASSIAVSGGIAGVDDFEISAANINKLANTSLRLSVSGYMEVVFKGAGFASGIKKLLAQVVLLVRNSSNAIAFTPQTNNMWFREEAAHIELSSTYRVPFTFACDYESVAAAGAFHVTLQNVFFAVSNQLGTFSAIDAVASASITCTATIEELKR